MLDILVYVGYVCTRFMTYVYYGHVSMDLMCGFMLRSNPMPKCGSYAILLIYMWYCGIYMLYMSFKGKKTAKEKGKKIISQLCQQHGTKLLAKLGFLPSRTCQLCQQDSFANSFVQWLCQQLGQTVGRSLTCNALPTGL